MVVQNKFINNINRVNGVQPAPTTQKVNNKTGSFGEVLQNKILESRTNLKPELKFSKHAEIRLQSRNINLSADQKQRINDAVGKAEAKGVRDSLVVVDNVALVVNVKSRTVITVANSNELKDNVFTNIDGAVFN